MNKDAGVSTLDTKSGVMEGVLNDYIKYAADCLGNYTLEFDLIGFDSQEEQIQALKENQIDMIFHVSQNPYASEQNDLALSNTVWTDNLVAVTGQSTFDENSENSVAIAKDDLILKWFVSYEKAD